MRHEERVVSRDASTKSVEPVLAALREQGAEYSVVERLPGGAWGAWLVRDRRDEIAILKCIWDSDWRLRLESAQRVVEFLRSRDAPVPRYLAAGFDARVGTWCLQERLQGSRVAELDGPLLRDVLKFSDLQVGVDNELPVFDWSKRLEEWMMTRAGSAMKVMKEQSPDGADLAARMKSMIATSQGKHLHSNDVVHGDFLATQFLWQDDHLSGVVDWDGAGRGDRGQDLALLFYNTFAQADRNHHPVNRDVVRELGTNAIALCGADRFGWFLAYEILLAFAFVHERNPAHIAWRIQLGERVAGSYTRLVLSA
jgi:Phosphotransferase enzyme family